MSLPMFVRQFALILLLPFAVKAADYVQIPAGQFNSALAIAGHAASLRLGSFSMRSEPVTNAEFLAFVRQHPEWQRGQVPSLLAGANYLRQWQGPLEPGESILPDQPVTQVSWFAGRAYCGSEQARLPNWYEWEYVSAADATRADARGDPARNQALLSAIQGTSGNLPGVIGTRPANVYGVRDLNRLLWEWTGDYAAMFPNPDARVPGSVASLALCGGSALAFADKNQYALMMRVAALTALRPADTASRVGFRCVRDTKGD
jgi:sulfatase modifying factor 1